MKHPFFGLGTFDNFARLAFRSSADGVCAVACEGVVLGAPCVEDGVAVWAEAQPGQDKRHNDDEWRSDASTLIVHVSLPLKSVLEPTLFDRFATASEYIQRVAATRVNRSTFDPIYYRIYLSQRLGPRSVADLLHHVERLLGRPQIGLGRFVDHLGDDRLALGDLAQLLGLNGIPAIAGRDLDTLAGVPGFKRMSMEAVGDDLPTTFLARRI